MRRDKRVREKRDKRVREKRGKRGKRVILGNRHTFHAE
jgi:hypothetical protein